MDEPHAQGSEDRLRPHPSDRFAGDSHAFDLNEALRDLRAEAHEPDHGHRQVTLFQRPPVTQVLFAFEPDGEMADHAAPGLVTIHVLAGRMAVQADGREHDLRAGHLLILRPDVRHSVRAAETSAMLLTVHLEADR